MKTKEPRISVRISPELKRRLEAVVELTGIDETLLVRNCVEAVCDEVERSGSLSFPLGLSRDAQEGNKVALGRNAGSLKAGTSCYPAPQPVVAALNEKTK